MCACCVCGTSMSTRGHGTCVPRRRLGQQDLVTDGCNLLQHLFSSVTHVHMVSSETGTPPPSGTLASSLSRDLSVAVALGHVDAGELVVQGAVPPVARQALDCREDHLVPCCARMYICRSVDRERDETLMRSAGAKRFFNASTYPWLGSAATAGRCWAPWSP